MRPPELFAKCKAEEEMLFDQDLGEQKNKWIIDLTFGPLLPEDPPSLNLKFPSLDMLASSSSEDIQAWASKYAFLLSSLRQARARDQDVVWLLLAKWLKQEKLFTPEEILPVGVLKRLTKNVRDRYRHLRPSQLLYANLVEVWLPYFEALFNEYRRSNNSRKKDTPAALQESGFDSHAVGIVTSIDRRRREPTSAAVEWASRRLDVDASAVSNAHSLVFGTRRRRR